MKTIGIVVEYNPFHNGHIYQIEKIKEMYPSSCIVVVMSSSFTMRGEVSILDKWQKTMVALKYGIDLVIELPFIFSLQSADVFAKYAIKLLNEVKIDTLVFGSETDDLTVLINIAKAQLGNEKLEHKVKEYINTGINYPTALSNAIYDITGMKVSEPNDILAVSYIKEVLLINPGIDLVNIKRTSKFNDIESNDNVVSASNIRNKYIKRLDYSNSVPKETYEYMEMNKIDLSVFYKLVRYKIISEKNYLGEYFMVDEGIEGRLFKYAVLCDSLESFIKKVKTKRYTYNRINRMLVHILIGIKKKDAKELEYIRVLGMSKLGQNHLKNIKGKLKYPIITKFTNKYPTLDYEYKATLIYSMINKNSKLITDEFKKHVIIKKY